MRKDIDKLIDESIKEELMISEGRLAQKLGPIAIAAMAALSSCSKYEPNCQTEFKDGHKIETYQDGSTYDSWTDGNGVEHQIITSAPQGDMTIQMVYEKQPGSSTNKLIHYYYIKNGRIIDDHPYQPGPSVNEQKITVTEDQIKSLIKEAYKSVVRSL